MAIALNPAVDDGVYTTTLEDLRKRVLRRLGFAAQVDNPPPGMAALVDEFLNDAQTQLAQQYPEMRTARFFTWTMDPGPPAVRFYSLDSDDEGATTPDYQLDPLRIEWVGIRDLNNAFTPMVNGIPPEYYTIDDQEGRPTHYEIRQAIEVLPAPDQAYTLVAKGHTLNFAFVDDADTCTIDPTAIFLLALSDAKAHYQQPDADRYARRAVTYIGNLTASAHGTRRYIPKTQVAPPLTKPVLIDP